MPTSPGVETQPKASGEKAIVIEWVGGTSEQVLMVEIRNRGTAPVDLSNFSLGDDSRRVVSDAHLKSVRGSMLLPPGALALVATGPQTNTDDEPRAKYQFVYRAVNSVEALVSLFSPRFALFDGTGAFVDGGEVDADDPFGLCCYRASGDPTTCNAMFSPNCDGSNPQCWAQIRKSQCCKESGLYACCFKESTSQYCPGAGCSGTGWVSCGN